VTTGDDDERATWRSNAKQDLQINSPACGFRQRHGLFAKDLTTYRNVFRLRGSSKLGTVPRWEDLNDVCEFR